MENIYSVIIGAFCTLFVGIISSPYLIPLFVNRAKGKRYLNLKDRLETIVGSWDGVTIQNVGISGTNMQVGLRMVLKRKNKTLIVGISTVSWSENGLSKSFEVELEGGFLNDSYLEISYKSKDISIVNFGVMFLKYSADGKTLEGKMMGFGHRIEEIIEGNSKLTKN